MISFPLQFPVTFIFSKFAFSKRCYVGKKLLICNIVFEKVIRERFVLPYVAVVFCLKIFDSLGSLEIKVKLFFKIDVIALSLGCHVLTNIVCGSLFSRVWSRNNSFLFHYFIAFFNSFSWKPCSIHFLCKIPMFIR